MRVPIFHRLVTNGFTMSGTMLHAKRYMRYFVYWPMLLHKAPLRRALVICYGVGLTAGAVTDLESVESIDVVEISRDVLQMSDVMYAPDAHPLHDRRVRLHLEDGRYFLQTTDERFDLITGEPPPPHAPGTVNLYTREYFRLVYDRLAEGGIATYWLPVARPEPEEMNVNAIIRAFCDVFEDCSLWNGTPFDWMLVGTRHATGPVSQTQFSKAWDPGPLGDRLREIGFEVPQQIGATFLGDVDYLKQLTATTLPLTDDFPRRLRSPYAGLPPSDPRKGDYYREIIDPDRARRAFEASRFIRYLWPERVIRETLPFFDHQGIINRTIFFGAASPLPQIEDLHFLLTQTTLRQLPLWLLGLGNHPSGPRLADLHSDEPDAVDHELGLHALAERDYLVAVAHLARSTQRGVTGAQPLLAYALCLAGRLDAAGEVARNARPRTQDEVDFWRWLGATFGVGPNAVPAGPGEEQRSPSRPNP